MGERRDARSHRSARPARADSGATLGGLAEGACRRGVPRRTDRRCPVAARRARGGRVVLARCARTPACRRARSGRRHHHGAAEEPPAGGAAGRPGAVRLPTDRVAPDAGAAARRRCVRRRPLARGVDARRPGRVALVVAASCARGRTDARRRSHRRLVPRTRIAGSPGGASSPPDRNGSTGDPHTAPGVGRDAAHAHRRRRRAATGARGADITGGGGAEPRAARPPLGLHHPGDRRAQLEPGELPRASRSAGKGGRAQPDGPSTARRAGWRYAGGSLPRPTPSAPRSSSGWTWTTTPRSRHQR